MILVSAGGGGVPEPIRLISYLIPDAGPGSTGGSIRKHGPWPINVGAAHLTTNGVALNLHTVMDADGMDTLTCKEGKNTHSCADGIGSVIRITLSLDVIDIDINAGTT